MKWVKIFTYSAGGILLAAALERLLIAAGNASALDLPEPMFGLPLRYATLIIGGLELFVALVCLFIKKTNLQLGLLTCLSANYTVYWAWAGLLSTHRQPQGDCIGSLTDPLHLIHGTSAIAITLIPVYLLLCSYIAFTWLWLNTKKVPKVDFSKISCSTCGGHVQFDSQNLGQKTLCPHCHQSLTLRPMNNLKMGCFFCHGHIEFPSHAVGKKILCPHCKMNITLKEPV